MWRFLPDVQPPKSKVQNAAEKREANKKYDADTRKRGFVESWREGREWLEFSKTEEKMRCKVCRLHPRNDGDRKAAFFIGTSSLRIGNVTSHEESQAHIWSMTCETNKQKKENKQETPSERAVQQLSFLRFYCFYLTKLLFF